MTGKLVLWFMSHLWAWFLAIVASLGMRKRMSHNNGTTAAGTVRVVDNPTFPAHAFFQPGRTWQCRLRHASVSYDDDTVTQVRAASLKFADSRYESPLDLELNTGTISLFWSGWNFLEFFTKQKPVIDGVDFVRFYRKYERGLIAARDGIRKYPSSFAQLYYHSQCAQRFVGQDGVLRYVKYRLIPADRGAETGLLTAQEMTPLWSEEVAPGETRSPNYLKKELAQRLAQKPVLYHLQLQLHQPVAGESPEICNCNRAWDEASHPWQDLATVTLQRVLSFDENNLMRFSVGHAPPSLGNLPARSMSDYNSVIYMRARSDIAKRARLLAYKLRGMPKQQPDERPQLVTATGGGFKPQVP